jgi:hypothetical protein
VNRILFSESDYRKEVECILDELREDPPDWVGADAHSVAAEIEEWKGWELGGSAVRAGLLPFARSAVAEAYWRLYEELNPLP